MSQSTNNCSICDFKCSNKYEFLNHMVFTHDYILYQCPKCDDVFLSTYSLAIHTVRVHKKNIKINLSEYEINKNCIEADIQNEEEKETAQQRADRIFKEDEEKQKLDRIKEEAETKVSNKKKRSDAIIKYDIKARFKKIRNKNAKFFLRYAIMYDTDFKTEEQEYNCIGGALKSFFNGMNEKFRDEFGDFASDFGCFDY
jgi:hypothetical protein